MTTSSIETIGTRLDLRIAIACGLLGLTVLAPFLWPVHRMPQSIFDSEWLAAVTFCLLLGALALGKPVVMRLGWTIPVWFAAFLVVAFVQLKLDRLSHQDQLYFAFIYGATAVAAYAGGRAIFAQGLRSRACTALAVAILIGALVSVCVQVLQLLNVSGLPRWIYLEITDPWARSRPTGNVGQANVLATYLCWAMIGVLLILRERRLLPVAVMVLVVLAFGAGLTRSRMALLFILLVTTFFWLPTALRPAQLPERIAMSIAILVGYAVSLVAIEVLVHFEGSRLPSAVGRLAEGTLALRTVMWADALAVSALAPLLGVGFGDYGASQYWVAQFHPALQPTPYVHNLVLQIAAEMGWPLAIGLMGVVGWWLLRELRQRMRDPAQAFIWVLVALVGVHSLLEWPLHTMLYLIPTCLLLGLGEALPDGRGIPVESRWLAVGSIFGLVIAVPTFLEYDALSDSIRDAQVRLSQGKEVEDAAFGTLIGLATTSRVRPFADRVLLFMVPPHRIEPTDSEIARVERALWQGADPRIITRLIVVNARAGKIDESARHVDRLLVFFPEEFEARRPYLLGALTDHAPRAEAVRKKIEHVVVPRVERPTGLPTRSAAPRE